MQVSIYMSTLKIDFALHRIAVAYKMAREKIRPLKNIHTAYMHTVGDLNMISMEEINRFLNI